MVAMASESRNQSAARERRVFQCRERDAERAAVSFAGAVGRDRSTVHLGNPLSANPIPRPPIVLSMLRSTCENMSNILRNASHGMPMPVSVTIT